jgi:hypothetical protein
LEEGPRKPGHSRSPAKAQGASKSVAMTLFMILLDYKYRQTSRMAPPRALCRFEAPARAARYPALAARRHRLKKPPFAVILRRFRCQRYNLDILLDIRRSPP